MRKFGVILLSILLSIFAIVVILGINFLLCAGLVKLVSIAVPAVTFSWKLSVVVTLIVSVLRMLFKSPVKVKSSD